MGVHRGVRVNSVKLLAQEHAAGAHQFSSVTQSCLTLCDPMDCSTPGLTVHHRLPELPKSMSTESLMPSNHLILCHPLLHLPSIFPSNRVCFIKKKKKKNFSQKHQFKIIPLNLHSLPPHHVSCGHLKYEGTDGRDVFWKHLERKIKANPRNYNVVKDLWM